MMTKRSDVCGGWGLQHHQPRTRGAGFRYPRKSLPTIMLRPETKVRSYHRGATVAIVSACALVATACSTNATTSTSHLSESSGSSKAAPVSMFGGQLTVASNLATNQFTKFAKKRFGLTFTFDLTPDEDVATKQPLLLASGQYPDVIWDGSITQEDALKYGSEGVYVPLNKLLKRYAPHVWHVIRTVPGFKQDVTAPNGKIYALPSYNYCFHCDWTYEYYINIKDLNKYNLALPRTTSQFAQVLKVFKQHGLTPLTGSGANGGGYAEDVVTYLMNSFIPFNGGLGSTSANYLDVKKGKIIFAPSQPQWRNGLAYLHSLYMSGDFSKVVFTQQASAVTRLISEQQVGVVPNGAIETAIDGYGSPSSHYLDWIGMPPLRGPDGASYSAFNAGGGIGSLVFAITNKATRAQEVRIMKLLNYIWTAKGFLKYNLGSYVVPAKPGQTGACAGEGDLESEGRGDGLRHAQLP